MKTHLITLLLLLPVAAIAQTTPDKFRVQVNVAANSDPQTCDIVQSTINKELRTLPDVLVGESNPDFIISIVALKMRTGSSYSGYAISSVVLITFNTNNFSLMFQGSSLEISTKVFSNAVTLENHQLNICALDELRSTCQDLVASFDTHTLETQRRLNTIALDAVNKQIHSLNQHSTSNLWALLTNADGTTSLRDPPNRDVFDAVTSTNK